MDISKRRYWQKPWSLISGCTPCSPGCDHCWSAGMEQRFGKRSTLNPYVSELCTNTGKFSGEIRLHPERLSTPLKRRKPTVYSIWNDWCHESVEGSFRLRMIDVTRKANQHTYLALTKRPNVAVKFFQIHGDPPANWWTGLTICNQPELDAKMGVFLQVPRKKFLSLEPLLSDINLSGPYHNFLEGWDTEIEAEYDHGGDPYPVPVQVPTGKIDAVILGGETGPGARPMHPDWVRSVRDQCANAGVPFFFKGWGEWVPYMDKDTPRARHYHRWGMGGQGMACVGRKSAGRLLDGRTHDELPWATNKGVQ